MYDNPGKLRIVQITDPHICPALESGRAGLNFLRTLSDCATVHPDLLLVTGDLAAERGGRQIYSWVKHLLSQTGFPYRCIPGNHDDCSDMLMEFGANVLPLRSSTVSVETLHQLALLYVDTSAGVLLSWQSDLIKSLLEKISEPALIFLHHPVLPVPVPYMEQNYPLRGRESLVEILRERPFPSYLFCGHYHAEYAVTLDTIHQFVTPSTWFQIAPFQNDFRKDHERPGFRVIDWDGGLLQTAVRYLW